MEKMMSDWFSGSETAFFWVLYKSNSIFTLGYCFFPLRFIDFFFIYFTSILQKCLRLSYKSYLHLSLFCRETVILKCFFMKIISNSCGANSLNLNKWPRPLQRPTQIECYFRIFLPSRGFSAEKALNVLLKY